ncbi:MAG: IS256 family transposase [Ktedonobacteraceae bacterium]|nr:IS256 family transposase [Ktedonobacteraceae bacterium]
MSEFYNERMFSVSAKEADPIEALVRRGAQVMLEAALEQEVREYLERARHQRSGQETEFRGYRNGSAKERKLTIGSGTIKIKAPRVSDVPAQQEPFESQIVKRYQRRSLSLQEVFPKLFIEGLATRDFEPALRCLMGEEAALSPSTISRLNARFKAEYEDWTKSSLASLPIVYVWVDGIYLKAGIADERACLLVVMGADVSGTKHLLAMEEGYRESKESWLAVLRNLKARGMNEPALAVGDGGLGFWAAAGEMWRQTKQQRCWVHKMRNVLDKLPHKERGEAAKSLRAIYLSRTREEAKSKVLALVKSWRALYDRAAECLLDDLDRVLAYFDFPAEHHKHIRTTNPVESVFASVRLRTGAMKRLRSARSAVYLIFQIVQRQEKSLQRLSHAEKLRHISLPGAVSQQTALAA